MSPWDWVVVAAFLLTVLCVGGLLRRRAGRSMADFFVGGRSLPWWLAGTSIMVSSFSADTPLHITKVMREQGMSGAWFYWASLLFAPMIPILFARLWRRAGIVTDCELLEVRYSGREATALRLLMALFRIAIESITMGWIVLGMTKVARGIMGLPATFALGGGVALPSDVLVVAVLVLVGVAYTAMSGLWGVAGTDLVEFVVALAGGTWVAVAAVAKAGGVTAMKHALAAQAAAGGAQAASFLPRLDGVSGGLQLGTFLVYVLVLGWSHAESDGGGYKAQRFLASKSEGHALAGGIFALAVKNIVRWWPWLIAGLASIVLYPHETDHEMAYPRMVADLLPSGVRGLVVAAFFGAFLATMATHLNLTSSYLVNDVYRRFLVRGRGEPHYVRASRVAVLGTALLAAAFALQMGSVLEALKLAKELVAGLGLVLIVRWFWWRVNPWSEIAAIVSSVTACAVLRLTGLGVAPVSRALGIDPATGDLFPARLLIILAFSIAATVAVTLLTPASDEATLRRFVARVRPAGGGFAALRPAGVVPDPILPQIVNWLLATVVVACATFAVGKLLLWEPLMAAGLLALSLGAGWLFLRRLGTLGYSAPPPASDSNAASGKVAA